MKDLSERAGEGRLRLKARFQRKPENWSGRGEQRLRRDGKPPPANITHDGHAKVGAELSMEMEFR